MEMRKELETVINNQGLDSYSQDVYNYEDFFNMVNEKESNTKRILIKGNKVKFIPLENALRFTKKDMLAKFLEIDESLIEDTQNSTNIVVKIEDKQYLLGNSAFISLKERIGIHGKGVEKLTTPTLCQVLNERFLDINEDVNIIISYGKIRAIMSAKYAIIKSNELFKSIIELSKERFHNLQFTVGYMDHTHSTIKVLFPNLKKLNETYSMPEEYTPGIIITTSDTGYSANKIGPCWNTSSGTSFIVSEEYIYRQHKGSVSLEDLEEKMPSIFNKYQDILLQFSKLMQIKIDYPIETLKKISSHLALGVKIKKRLIDNFSINYNNVNITAYDLCKEILGLDQYVINNKIDFQEKIGKAIFLNYSRFDCID